MYKDSSSGDSSIKTDNVELKKLVEDIEQVIKNFKRNMLKLLIHYTYIARRAIFILARHVVAHT